MGYGGVLTPNPPTLLSTSMTVRIQKLFKIHIHEQNKNSVFKENV